MGEESRADVPTANAEAPAGERPADGNAPPRDGDVSVDGEDASVDGEASSLAGALELRRQVHRGAVGGLVVAAGVFALFVGIPGTDRSPLLYLGLAVVVAATAGGLLTLALVAVAARRLAGRL